jgi:general secretion pathway protein D
MKRMLVELTAVCLISVPLAVGAQVKPDQAKPEVQAKLDNTLLEQLIEAVARKTGKKIIVDPRVRAQVVVYGISSSTVSYKELLGILNINGYAAVESEGLVYVLPEAEVRSMPIPTLSGSKQYDDNEFVTKIIPIKSISAAMLVPALRPILPQYGHLAAINCANNSIIVIDHFANVKRIQSVIDLLDKGEPIKIRDCSNDEAKK